ncbi:MAG: DUF3108 domain-containing protein [Ramlibacter sp.]
MSPATGVPWRPLVVITVAVLCLHALALRGAPGPLQWTGSVLRMLVSVREAPPPTASVDREAIGNPAHAATPAVRPAPAPSKASATAPVSRASRQAPALATLSVPPSATWRYAVAAHWRGIPVSGGAVLAWKHDGSTYDASLVLDAPPLQSRTQLSTGTLAAEGLRPSRFSDRVRSEEATHFDRAQGRITFSSNRPDVALQPGAQDRLSVLVQLAALVAGHSDRFIPGASVTLQVAGTRDADAWRFTVEGVERLAIGAATVGTLKLTRAPRGEYDTRLELWLAPGQAYAPVRLRLTPPNGDWLDMQWPGTDKR